MVAFELPNLSFEKMNEADIRAELIDPLLRSLGYQSGTENNILRERQIELRYPHMFLGRKKPGKDPVLRGKPDYICEVRGFGRWVIEAKPPDKEIGPDDVEQAHSYSVHPEIQAPIFAISNGRSFFVYETNRGPGSEPLIDFTYDDLRKKTHVLVNLLSPSGIRKRYPIRPVDFRKPLATGFGSHVNIVGGFSRYDEIEIFIDGMPPGTPQPELPQVQNICGVEHRIAGDACYRNETDGIVADIRVPTFHQILRQFAQNFDIEVNRYVCRDANISQDSELPNIFETTLQFAIPPGTEMLDVTKWETAITEVPVRFSLYAEAVGCLKDGRFGGSFNTRILASSEVMGLNLDVWMFLRGVYEIEFAPN